METAKLRAYASARPSGPAGAEEPDRGGRDEPIDMELIDAPLRDLMLVFGDVMQEPILVAEGLEGATVSLTAKGTPAIDVLDDALEQAGAQWEDIDTVRLLEADGDIDADHLTGRPVTAHFEDALLEDVLRTLSARLDAPIDFVAPPGDPLPTITAHFEGTPPGQALTEVLEQTDLGFAEIPGLLVTPIEEP